MKTGILLCVISALLPVGYGTNLAVQSVDQASAQELIQNGAILIDVRTKQEYEEGYIEEVISLNSEMIEKKVPDKDTPIILYCRSGNRSKEASKKLIKADYKNVYGLGRMSNWSR